MKNEKRRMKRCAVVFISWISTSVCGACGAFDVFYSTLDCHSFASLLRGEVR